MSFRLFAALLFCGLLAGCGFRPLYGDFGDGDVGTRFLRVEIDPAKDREGQILNNELVRLLYGSREPERPIYRLTMKLNQQTTSLVVRKSAFATRAYLDMRISFKLTDIATGAHVHSGNSRATVSYNILDSEFATLLAEKDARERGLRVLSQDMRVRLGTFFDRLAHQGQ